MQVGDMIMLTNGPVYHFDLTNPVAVLVASSLISSEEGEAVGPLIAGGAARCRLLDLSNPTLR